MFWQDRTPVRDCAAAWPMVRIRVWEVVKIYQICVSGEKWFSGSGLTREMLWIMSVTENEHSHQRHSSAAPCSHHHCHSPVSAPSPAWARPAQTSPIFQFDGISSPPALIFKHRSPRNSFILTQPLNQVFKEWRRNTRLSPSAVLECPPTAPLIYTAVAAVEV